MTAGQLKETVSVGLLGYGLLRAWVVMYLMIARQLSAEQFWYSFLLMSVIALAALLVVPLRRLPAYDRHEPLFDTLFLALGVAGSCFVFFGNQLCAGEYLNAGFAAIGLCGGYFEVRWGERFLPYSDRKVYCNLLLAFLLAAIIGIVASANVPSELALAESLVLVGGMGALYMSSRHADGDRESNRASLLKPSSDSGAAPKGTARTLFNITLTVLLFSFVQMSSTSICYSSLPVSDIYNARFIANFATAGLLLLVFLLRGAISGLGLLKALLPITATGLFLQILDQSALAMVPVVILLVGNKLFDVLMLLLVIELSQRGRANPTLSFSLFVGGKNFGCASGIAIGDGAVALIGSDPTLLSLFIGLLEVLLVVSFLWMFGIKDIASPASQAADRSDAAAPVASLHERALAAAGRYGLTPRETEILELLARGKNRETIARDHHLSKSTVHTHMIHIYQKTGVHGQQELIELVESISPDESPSTSPV